MTPGDPQDSQRPRRACRPQNNKQQKQTLALNQCWNSIGKRVHNLLINSMCSSAARFWTSRAGQSSADQHQQNTKIFTALQFVSIYKPLRIGWGTYSIIFSLKVECQVTNWPAEINGEVSDEIEVCTFGLTCTVWPAFYCWSAFIIRVIKEVKRTCIQTVAS